MRSLLPLALLALATDASADVRPIQAWTTTAGASLELKLEVEGTPGQFFVVCSSPLVGQPFDPTSAARLGHGWLDAGGSAMFQRIVANPSLLPPNFAVDVWVLSRRPGGFEAQRVFLPLTGAGGTLCQDFDPDFTMGPVEPVAGQPMDNEWASMSLSISATNAVATHPDMAIVFDSAAPTGGDDDLRTPGAGPGNTEALGNLIIIAENDVDANGDGLVDVPDDEEMGGVLRFDYAEPYRMVSATLVDIDDQDPSELRFYIGSALTLETIPLTNTGDNSVQTVTFDKRDVRRFEVALGGSGGLAHVGMVPCPMSLSFDETPFGRPLDVAAGTWMDDELAFMGVTLSALNSTAGHPDKAILFDSANPTGDDVDLLTPGPGINNTEALGQVLILAENDVDANGDGLVDDPDDEEFGGRLTLEFTEPITFFQALVIDCDGAERHVFDFFDPAGNALDTLAVDALGDNSVQTLAGPQPISGVGRIEVELSGSGALSRLRWCPDSNFGGQ